MDFFDPLDPQSVPLEFIKESNDWIAVFNPRVLRQMDVQLAAKFQHDGVICSAKFSTDGSLLAVGSDGAVVLYDLANGMKIIFPLEPPNSEFEAAPPRKPNHVRTVAISPDGTLLFAGSEDGLIRVFSIISSTMTHIDTLTSHNSEVYALCFSPSGSLLASASGDRTVRIWSVSHDSGKTKIINQFTLQHSPPTDGAVLITEPNVSKLAFTSVAIDVSEKYVAAGSLDGGIRIWDLPMIDDTVWPLTDLNSPPEPMTVVPFLQLTSHTDGVYGVLFVSASSSADLGLVSASLDRTLKVWDIQTGEREGACVKTLTGHKDSILAISYVSSGREQRIASGSRDGSVRVWDLRKGEPMFGIIGHRDTVTTIDLCLEGQLLASGSGDREVRIWQCTIL